MGTSHAGLCTYCATAEGQTRDHVIARGFFPKDQREGIPCVPACQSCNNQKSLLEHQFTSVLPFGATHAGAAELLSTLLPGRLEKNLKLARRLADGKQYRFVSRDGTSWEPEMTLPLDGEALSQLFQMMTRGLAFAEFGLLLPEADCVVLADFMTPVGAQLFDSLHAQRGNRTGAKNLGEGIFRYQGVQSFESPQLTVWRMSLYGIAVSGDPSAPEVRGVIVHAISAPRRMAAARQLVELLRGRAA